MKLVTHLVQDTDDHRGARRQSRALKQRMLIRSQPQVDCDSLTPQWRGEWNREAGFPFGALRADRQTQQPRAVRPAASRRRVYIGRLPPRVRNPWRASCCMSAVKDEESLLRGELLELSAHQPPTARPRGMST